MQPSLLLFLLLQQIKTLIQMFEGMPKEAKFIYMLIFIIGYSVMLSPLDWSTKLGFLLFLFILFMLSSLLFEKLDEMKR